MRPLHKLLFFLPVLILSCTTIQTKDNNEPIQEKESSTITVDDEPLLEKENQIIQDNNESLLEEESQIIPDNNEILLVDEPSVIEDNNELLQEIKSPETTNDNESPMEIDIIPDEQIDPIISLMKTLTIEEKIGQLFFINLRSDDGSAMYTSMNDILKERFSLIKTRWYSTLRRQYQNDCPADFIY